MCCLPFEIGKVLLSVYGFIFVVYYTYINNSSSGKVKPIRKCRYAIQGGISGYKFECMSCVCVLHYAETY